MAPLFPGKKSLPESIGEVWLTGKDCCFAGGPFAGQKLGDAWPRMGEEWTGRKARERLFPLLVKFIFPEDKLSVQVHPGDDYAREHESAAGGVGKTEMWYVVSARAGAEVRVGLKPGVTAEILHRAIADGSAEERLQRIAVSAGDAIFVPAGTVHTIGPGMILCEIQQNSDLTYRVFDFHRLDAKGQPRALHIEKAFDVIHFGKQDGGKINLSTGKCSSEEGVHLVTCPYFSVAKWEFANPQILTKPAGRLELAVILEGSGGLATEPGNARGHYSRAQAWTIPAALQSCRFEPEEKTTLLRAHVPEEAPAMDQGSNA